MYYIPRHTTTSILTFFPHTHIVGHFNVKKRFDLLSDQSQTYQKHLLGYRKLYSSLLLLRNTCRCFYLLHIKIRLSTYIIILPILIALPVFFFFFLKMLAFLKKVIFIPSTLILMGAQIYYPVI